MTRSKRPCYFQGCIKHANTKEHIPAKSFFPRDQRNQLLTVQSCPDHNTEKSSDDIYVLAHICMNASPNNRSREVFQSSILPQLTFNNEKFRKLLASGSVIDPSGSVRYRVDISRFDRYFSALSCGMILKACKQTLPAGYRVAHVYHNFLDDGQSPEEVTFMQELSKFYSGIPMHFMNLGQIKTLNTTIYSVKIFGTPEFRSSITIIHEFFGTFKVTSMLTRMIEPTEFRQAV